MPRKAAQAVGAMLGYYPRYLVRLLRVAGGAGGRRTAAKGKPRQSGGAGVMLCCAVVYNAPLIVGDIVGAIIINGA